MPVTRRPVVISAQSVTEGAASIVLSNVSIVNACLDDLLTQDELSIQALQSYYVDYFQAQVDNGGFTQFVYNSRASDTVAQLVHDGLAAMGAQLHVSAFDEGARLLKEAGRRGRDALLATDYGSSSRLRTRLAKLSPTFDRARAAENLTELNARWLLADPDVVVLPRDQIEAHIAASVATIPDIDDRRRRRATARAANVPRYERGIRALCDHLGWRFDRITVGDPTFLYLGELTIAWYFLSSRGLTCMIEHDGQAIAVDDATGAELGRIPYPNE